VKGRSVSADTIRKKRTRRMGTERDEGEKERDEGDADKSAEEEWDKREKRDRTEMSRRLIANFIC